MNSAQSSDEFELEEPSLEWRSPKEYWEQIKAAEAIVRLNPSCELVPNSEHRRRLPGSHAELRAPRSFGLPPGVVSAKP